MIFHNPNRFGAICDRFSAARPGKWSLKRFFIFCVQNDYHRNWFHYYSASWTILCDRWRQLRQLLSAAFDNSSDRQSEQSDSNKKDCQPSGFSNQHIYLFIRAKLGIFLVQIEKENNERHDSHVGSLTWQVYCFIQCHKQTLWNVGRNVCLIDMEQYVLPCLFCRKLYVPNVPSMVHK